MIKSKKTKYTALLLPLLMLSQLLLPSCGRLPATEEKLSVVASVFPCYDFARELAGDAADIRLLLPPGSESHSYEPTSSDLLLIGRCDVFIYNGGESDGWVEEILSSLPEGDKIRTVRMMDAVSVLPEDDGTGRIAEADGTASDESENAVEYDEHIWTSLRNSERIVSLISDALCEAEPGSKQLFEKNRDSYISELEGLDSDFSELFDSVPEKTMVFGDRFPFLYFIRDYSIPYYAAFPGCAEQTEPSISTIVFLIDKVKEENISTVFYFDLSSPKTAQSIAESTGTRTALLYSCHNVTLTQLSDGETYLSLMRKNYETIKASFE